METQPLPTAPLTPIRFMAKYSIALIFSLICTLLTPLAARAATVPGGTVLWVRTLDPVSSGDKAGKRFTARLDTDLIVNGKVTAPAGSKVYGRVEPSRSERQSKFDLSLTHIVVNGRPVAIAAESYEQPDSRSARKAAGRVAAGTTIGSALGGSAAGYAIGAVGTAIGAAFGIPAAGVVIAAVGTTIAAPFVGHAAGSAVGAATEVISQGKPVVAPPGTSFEFRLAQPVSL